MLLGLVSRHDRELRRLPTDVHGGFLRFAG